MVVEAICIQDYRGYTFSITDPLRDRVHSITNMRNTFRILSVTSVVAIAMIACASQRGHKRPVNYIVPFHLISKSMGYKVFILPKKWVTLGAFRTNLTSEVAPQVKKEQYALQLEYGSKKGGIVTIYETKKVKGLTGVALTKALLDAHIFGDRNRMPGFAVIEVPDSELIIGLAGNDMNLINQEKADLVREK